MPTAVTQSRPDFDRTQSSPSWLAVSYAERAKGRPVRTPSKCMVHDSVGVHELEVERGRRTPTVEAPHMICALLKIYCKIRLSVTEDTR
jgi:hypothetical protein